MSDGETERREDSFSEPVSSAAAIFWRMLSRASDSLDFNFSSSAATRCAICSSRDLARVEFVCSKESGCQQWKPSGTGGSQGRGWRTSEDACNESISLWSRTSQSCSLKHRR